MRITVVGAGVAGLTAAFALQADRHEVRVLEQAPALRAGGFGLNIWSNATTLLAELGFDVPGRPFDRMDLRAGNRVRTVMRLPATGAPHVDVDRGVLLRALADRLTPGTIELGVRGGTRAELLADGADLVVAADGSHSELRLDFPRRPERTGGWRVWQAVVTDVPADLPLEQAAVVVDQGRFVGAWRLPGKSLEWFYENPSTDRSITAPELLDRLRDDDDDLVRGLATATTVDAWTAWEANDRWPNWRFVGDRLAVIGDAAHPMLPCIGQGACMAIEDAVILARSVRGDSLASGLARFQRRRRARVLSRAAIAKLACALRRPGPVTAPIIGTPLCKSFGATSALALRALARPPLTGTRAGG
jgi:2-polyprenyl-6-methoxyphenol hydroxylase-like FAD-dependent oxidoreductase